jgi:hypothetical protein
MATGHIQASSDTYDYSFTRLGSPTNQNNVLMWADTWYGTGSIEIWWTGKLLFKGNCRYNDTGEQRLKDICPYSTYITSGSERAHVF